MDTKQPDRRLSARDILLIVFRRKRLFFSVLLLIPALVTVGVYVIPVPYKTVGKLIVQRTRSAVVPILSRTSALMQREEVLNTEVEILRSRTVAEAVVEELRLHEKPPPQHPLARFVASLRQLLLDLGLLDEVDPKSAAVASLMNKLKVKTVALTNVIEVSYVGDDPQAIARIVNVTMNTFLAQRFKFFKPKRAKEFFRQQVDTLGAELLALRAQKLRVKEKSLTGDVKADRGLVTEGLTELRSQLRTTAMRQAGIAQKIEIVTKGAGYAPFNDREGSYLIVDTMGTRLLELELERERLSGTLRAGSSELRKLNGEIKKLRGQIAHSLRSIEGELVTRTKLLRSQVAEMDEQRKLLDERETRLDQIAAAIGFAERMHDRYLGLHEEARLAESAAAGLGNVKVLDRALPPPRPILPRAAFIVVACFLGFATAFGLVVLLEQFGHRIDSAEDVEGALGLRVYCVIPRIRRINRAHRSPH